MSKTQIFIEKARAKHGSRYSYDRVVYVGAHGKVIIACSKHGEFEQTANSHLSGNGCAKCGKESMAIKRSKEAKDNFIERSRAVHGGRYDYSETVYVRSGDKVIITCKKHGDFEQIPSNHLSGFGCAKCSGMHRHSTQEWIEKAIAVHGDRYDYTNVEYVNAKTNVSIACANHGDFEQTPKNHLDGKGCVKCGYDEMAIKQSQEAKDSFIEKACAIHGDKYDYLKTVYTRAIDKVTITCKIHGDFEQTPKNHLKGQGCPSCPARYDQPTNLYLMRNGLGKVKVGYTIDLNRRITELNSSAPFKAELLETWTLPDMPAVRKIESKVHRKLAKYHAGLSGFEGATEWFNTTPERAKGAILKALSGAEVLGHSEANSLQLALI